MRRVRDVQHVIRIREGALLIAFLAIAGMLELVVGRDSPGRAAHDAGGSPYLP